MALPRHVQTTANIRPSINPTVRNRSSASRGDGTVKIGRPSNRSDAKRMKSIPRSCSTHCRLVCVHIQADGPCGVMTGEHSRLEKRIVIGVFIILTLAIIVAEYLNFTDFCYSEGRYLGDRALVDRTIRYEIDRVNTNQGARGVTKYASVEEFRQANPACCHLEKWGDPMVSTVDRRFRIWMRRILGVPIFVVLLQYRVSNEGPHQFWSSHYLINACGKVREGGGGEMSRAAPSIWQD
jgi:hypothetical protein